MGWCKMKVYTNTHSQWEAYQEALRKSRRKGAKDLVSRIDTLLKRSNSNMPVLGVNEAEIGLLNSVDKKAHKLYESTSK
jgi:hypothetical protein